MPAPALGRSLADLAGPLSQGARIRVGATHRKLPTVGRSGSGPPVQWWGGARGVAAIQHSPDGLGRVLQEPGPRGGGIRRQQQFAHPQTLATSASAVLPAATQTPAPASCARRWPGWASRSPACTRDRYRIHCRPWAVNCRVPEAWASLHAGGSCGSRMSSACTTTRTRRGTGTEIHAKPTEPC